MTMTKTRTDWTNRFAARTRSGGGEALAAILALSGRTDIISFSGGLPDPATLPGEALVGVMQTVLAGHDASALQYSPVKGLPGPLSYIAERLEALEHHRPAPDELLVTSGCIEALELLGKALLDRGDVALVEAPTYMGATMGFQSFEAEVIEVTMDADGVRLDLLDQAMNAARAKLFYTIPDYQNPTGVSLSRERRQQLVDLARDRGVLVVEDVTYRELGFYGDRLPSLWSLAPDGVVQIGTFSKTFFPGVRLGWACGPSEIIEQMIRAKQNTDQCAGSMGQRLLEEYGRSGALDRQVDRARAFYRGRRELMMQALATHMPEGVSWTEPRGGFVTWLTLPDGVDAVQVATRAMEDAIAIVPGSVFFSEPSRGRNNLRLSYSGVQDDVIDEGIRRLGVVLRRTLNQPGQKGNV